MNIGNFEWEVFRHSIHTFNWWEAGMASFFIIAGLVSIKWTKKTGSVDGKSVNALFCLLLGSIMGLAFKLFAYLDVTVILHAVLVVVFFLDFKKTRDIRNRLLKAEDALNIKKRRDSLIGGVKSTGRADASREHREHSHSHSHHSHHHHERGRSHSSDHDSDASAKEPKNPIHDDPLTDE